MHEIDVRDRAEESVVDPTIGKTAKESPDIRRRSGARLFGLGTFLLLAAALAFGASRSYSKQREVMATAEEEARTRCAVVGTAAVFLGSPAELRPDEREHAVGEPAGLEVALEGEQRARGDVEAVRERLRLVRVRVVLARSRDRDAAERELGGEHRGEPGHLAREAVVALRVRNRAAEAVVAVLRERRELAAQPVGLRGRLRGLVQERIGAARAERCERLEHPVLDLAPDAGRPERVLVGRCQRGNRDPPGGQRRLQLVVEREPLKRVVHAPGTVEVAAHPAARQARVGRADLPEVA